MSIDKCVKCKRRLRQLKQYNEKKHQLINSEDYVECERCNILYKKKDGFIGVDW